MHRAPGCYITRIRVHVHGGARLQHELPAATVTTALWWRASSRRVNTELSELRPQEIVSGFSRTLYRNPLPAHSKPLATLSEDVCSQAQLVSSWPW